MTANTKPKWQTLFEQSHSLLDDWEDQLLNDKDLKKLPDENKTKIVETLLSKFQEQLIDFIREDDDIPTQC